MTGGTSPSKVDAAERALRDWLAPGRYRAQDRLPPEHDLAAMLGVSRGTLRAALARLERDGTIERRRGSGTFVAAPGGTPETFAAGLEVLESYSLLAARLGMAIGARAIAVRHGRPDAEAAAALALPDDGEALVVERVLLVEDVPAAWMRDTLAEDLPLPPEDELRPLLESGRMILDVLQEVGVPVSFARTEIRARLLEPSDPVGCVLGIAGTTAALDVVETMRTSDGRPVQYSQNVFGPGRLGLHVMRALPPGPPAQLAAVSRHAGQSRRAPAGPGTDRRPKTA